MISKSESPQTQTGVAYRMNQFVEFLSIDARHSVDICRIIVSIAALLSPLFYQDYHQLMQASAEQYPKGIINLLLPFVPNITWLFYVKYIGFVAALLSLFGIYTRLNFRIATLALLILASLFYSFTERSSHQFHALLFTFIGLSFAPIGRRYSIDAHRHQPPPVSEPHPLAYALPILLVQFLLCWIFFSAFTYKIFIVSGLNWFLSDNLRHIFIWQDIEMGTENFFRGLFATSEVLYKSVGLLNLVCQGGAMLSLFFIRNPLLRMCCGALYIAEVVGLYVVMGRFHSVLPFNFEWVLLVCFFVDWDWLWRRTGAHVPELNRHAPRPRVIIFSALAIAGISMIASYLQKGWDRPYLYPLSTNAMFSFTLAKQPFSKHQSFEYFWALYELDGAKIEIGTDAAEIIYPASDDDKYDSLPKLERHLRTMQDITISQNEGRAGQEFALKTALYTIPAHPNPPASQLIFSELNGKLTSDGVFQAVWLTYDAETGLIRLESKNLPAHAEMHIWARHIEYHYLETLGHKHSEVINQISSRQRLDGKWIDANTFQPDIIPGSGPILLSLSVHHTHASEPDFYIGPIVER